MLMDETEADTERRPRERARLYRDGLMTAFRAHQPLRLANLIGLEIGHHLLRENGVWWLEIDGETKTRQPCSAPFPRSGRPGDSTLVHRAGTGISVVHAIFGSRSSISAALTTHNDVS